MSKQNTLDTCQSWPSAENSPSRRSGGGTGRHVRLRGVCRKACGFKSRPEHLCFYLWKKRVLTHPLAESRTDLGQIWAAITIHIYEVRPRKDKRGVDLISDALPFGRLWYGERDAVANAVGYTKHCSRSHDAVIRVYDDAGNLIETHEHAGDFKEP